MYEKRERNAVRLRMSNRKKPKVKTYRRAAVNAAIVAVVLLLFVYVGIQLSRNFSSQVSTQRTQKVTDVTYAYLDGYIFTDSEVLTSDSGIVHYLVSDGEKVGVGQAYAELYPGSGLAEDERRETEKRLNALSAQIALLEGGMEHAKDASDLGAISDEISESYYSYIDSVLGGDFKSAHKTGDTLLGALSDYSAVTLSEVTENALAALTAERESLIASIGGTSRTLISDRSFTFFYNPDGYEKIFHSSRLEGLTRETLDTLAKDKAETAQGAIGTAVYSSKWYIAIPADDAEYAEFKNGIGKTYSVELRGGDGISVDMLLENIVSDEDDRTRSYLLFSSLELSSISGAERTQSVRVKLGSCSGYRIPEGALHRVGEEDGVYILVGNMIEFRRVTLIGRGEGYYIANTYENDLAEGSKGDIPYLSANELIVISGRDLYDGKLLN